MKQILSGLILLLAIPVMFYVNDGVLMVLLPVIQWAIKGNLLLVLTGGFVATLTVALIVGFVAAVVCVIMGKLTIYKGWFSIIVGAVVLIDLGIRIYSTWELLNFENFRTWVSFIYIEAVK